MDMTAGQSLTSTSSTIEAKLSVPDTRLLHFSLAVAGSTANDAVRLTIFDQNQHAVATSFTSTGGTVTFNTLLTPGTYYLGFAGGQTTGQALSNAGVAFSVSYVVLSDPIDPPPADPIGGSGSTDPGSGGGSSGPYNPVTGPWDTFSPIVTPLPPPPVTL
jgi:hypothetical protein